MVKLLQISIEVNSGSVGRIAEQIGEIVLQNGGESYITYARNNNPSKSKTIKVGSRYNIYFHGIVTRLLDNHGFCSQTATRNLIKTIKEIKPSIIHLHHLHGYFINIEILFQYLKESNIPVVWTFHDCWSFTGHCVHFDFVGCEKWKTQCHNCEQKNEYPKSLLLDRSQQNYIDKKRIFNSVENLTIVSVSNWLFEKVSESFLNKFDSRMIYNGVDIDKFYPSKSRHAIDEKYTAKGKYVILGVATTWEKRKGLEDFIALSKILDEGYLMILIGLDEKQIETLPNSIIGLKRTESQEELCELYAASDLFMNLSVEETFGLTTAEAMACGTPTIVYNATASPELVNEEVGFVVEKNDIGGLLIAIEKAKRLGKSHYTDACRNRAITLFDKRNRFLDYFNLYNEILIKSEK